VIGAASVTLDVLILCVLASVVVILGTGGGVIHALGTSVRAHGVENPIWILTALTLVRYAMGSRPFLGIRRWPREAMLQRGRDAVTRFPASAAARLRAPLIAITCLAVMVFLIRVFLAWRAPGFFSGDDVEIHEMTLGVLLRKPWPVWNLRCAFFPMVFVYPAQRLALTIGWSSPERLVLAGRIAVALASTAAIPLTWYAARQLRPDDARIAAVAVLLFAINKLQMSFGSSELPRPVSTVFVLAAFVCVLRGRVVQSAIGGVLLGAAVACRFSEVVFIVAALVTVRREQYFVNGLVLLLSAAATAAAIIGVSDALYWGHPFSSLVAALDYTVVRRQSSRGYEPPWGYLTIIPAWSTYIFVALALAGSGRRNPETWWLWIPIGVFSLLPHKEGRYLLPVIAFLCIAAARGFLRLTAWLQRSTAVVGWRCWARDLAAPFLVLAVLHEAGGWRLSRSDEGVRLAERLRATGGTGLAGQDLWRLGGRPYLWPLDPVTELPPELLGDQAALAGLVGHAKWVVVRSRLARTAGDAAMRGLGFARDPSFSGEDYVLYTRER